MAAAHKGTFTGKVVAITGASSGIGAALAQEYARQGAHLVLQGRQPEALKQVADACRALGSSVQEVLGDVTDPATHPRIAEAARQLGRLDVFVANAGISMRAWFAHTQPQVLHRVMDVNFWGVVDGVRAVLPLLQQHRGLLVGVSSVAGIKGLPGRTAYSASKFALNGFLEALRIELMERGVQVQTVMPGYVQSRIRDRALTAEGGAQGSSPRHEAKAMPAAEAARRMVRAAARRKRSLILDRDGWLAHHLQYWAPAFADRAVLRKIKREEAEMAQPEA